MDKVEALTALLYKHDLEGLAGAGAPSREYKPEAVRILKEMENRGDVTPTIMHEVMADIFAKMFTLKPDVAKERNLASEKFRKAAEEAVINLW